MKQVGFLTNVDDCGGLNDAIRSIFFRAKDKYTMAVFGIRK
jgi:6-phosphofructokinase|tara:strand:- start:144 stop:266 length:123 start_codon:yes stop_codon:yes gene_type:complete